MQARAPWQADDIDGVTYVERRRTASLPGTFVDVVLEDVVEDVDFARVARQRRVARRRARAACRARCFPCSDRSEASVGDRRARSEIMERARALFPGGVSSPVRAFRGVGGEPFVVAARRGLAHLGRRRHASTSTTCCRGARSCSVTRRPSCSTRSTTTMRHGTSFGIPTELEVELGELIVARMPHVEMLRFVSSGTEATMSAIRLARAATERDVDPQVRRLLSRPRGLVSRARRLGRRDARPAELAGRARRARRAHRRRAVQRSRRRSKRCCGAHRVAAIIVEPVVGNGGFIAPDPAFLPGLRDAGRRTRRAARVRRSDDRLPHRARAARASASA